MTYESTVTISSKTCPGVTFAVRRMSFGNRFALMRQVRDLVRGMEFHAAGESTADKVEGAILAAELDKLFLTWGAVNVSGLSINGREPDPEMLYEHGPEALAREIVEAVKRETSLSEEEAKN